MAYLEIATSALLPMKGRAADRCQLWGLCCAKGRRIGASSDLQLEVHVHCTHALNLIEGPIMMTNAC